LDPEISKTLCLLVINAGREGKQPIGKKKSGRNITRKKGCNQKGPSTQDTTAGMEKNRGKSGRQETKATMKHSKSSGEVTQLRGHGGEKNKKRTKRAVKSGVSPLKKGVTENRRCVWRRPKTRKKQIKKAINKRVREKPRTRARKQLTGYEGNEEKGNRGR